MISDSISRWRSDRGVPCLSANALAKHFDRIKVEYVVDGGGIDAFALGVDVGRRHDLLDFAKYRIASGYVLFGDGYVIGADFPVGDTERYINGIFIGRLSGEWRQAFVDESAQPVDGQICRFVVVGITVSGCLWRVA